ncbi:MAG TPA: hypothetical protein VGM27_10855 [Acidobacteriaceae bacterium]
MVSALTVATCALNLLRFAAMRAGFTSWKDECRLEALPGVRLSDLTSVCERDPPPRDLGTPEALAVR